jgi:hypothetical protein
LGSGRPPSSWAEYRQVQKKLAEAGDEINSDQLLAVVKKVETQLWPRVERPQEAVLDAKVVRTLAMITANMARKLKVNASDLKPGDIAARRLEAGFGSGAASWVEMGRWLQHLFAHSITLTFLNGALGHGPAEVVPAMRKWPRQVDRVCDLQATKEMRVHELEGEADETDDKVEELYTALVEECRKAKGAVPYL